MIIDCHSHVASHAYFPQQFSSDWAKSIRRSLPYSLSASQESRIEDLFYQMFDDRNCQKLVAEMNTAGISKSVLLIIDFGVAFPDVPVDIKQIHMEHKKLMQEHDRFVAFSGIDPRRGQEGIDLFEKAVVEWGFKGLKLYPPCGFSPSDKRLFSYYEICSAHRIPVLTHIGPTISSLSYKYAYPVELDDAARLFPDVNFIMGHAGAVFFEESAYLAQYRPNIYLDLSGFQGELKHGRLHHIMKYHLAKGLSKKILFGTDWPIHRFFGTQKKWVEVIKGLVTDQVLSNNDLDNIMFKNFQDILQVK